MCTTVTSTPRAAIPAAERERVWVATELDGAPLATDAPTLSRALAALDAVQTALRINPGGHPAVLTLLGVLNRRAGRSEEAVALWEQVRAQESLAGERTKVEKDRNQLLTAALANCRFIQRIR